MLGILLLAIVSDAGSARAEGEGRTRALSLGAGWFDFNRQRDEAVELRVEYRAGPAGSPLRALAIATATDDSSLFLGLGLGYEIHLGSRLALTPSLAPGYYRRGNGKDLGYSLEFRTQVELGYRLSGGVRLVAAAAHISNAGLGSRNPGEESLAFGCEIPLTRWTPRR